MWMDDGGVKHLLGHWSLLGAFLTFSWNMLECSRSLPLSAISLSLPLPPFSASTSSSLPSASHFMPLLPLLFGGSFSHVTTISPFSVTLYFSLSSCPCPAAASALSILLFWDTDNWPPLGLLSWDLWKGSTWGQLRVTQGASKASFQPSAGPRPFRLWNLWSRTWDK